MALPAFDRERLLEQGYAARLFALRRDALERALAARPQSLYGVCLSAVAACNEPTAIAHLPGALALLPPIDVAAATADLVAAIKSAPVTHGSSEVQPAAGAIFPAARIRRPVSMRVTLVALARYDDAELDQRIATLEPALARVGGEVLVRRPDRPGESLARLANTALAQVTSEAVCFIGEGVSAEDDTWLEEMLGRLAGPDVGAVGPVLLDSAGRVREAGLVLGPRFDAVPAFADHASDEAGYADALAVARECSAIGGACFLASKAQLAAVAGFDAQRFPEHYPFVDLCLRLRARGGRIIVTPHARLVQARAAPAAEPPSRERERSRLRGLWGEVIAADPTYSPLLNRDAEPFTALAWPPRGFELRHSHGEQPLTSPLLPIL